MILGEARSKLVAYRPGQTRKAAMNVERLHQIEKIYRAALELQPAERGSFLERSCGQDEDLRRELEALFAHTSEPTASLVEAGPADGGLVLPPGTRLGPYAIVGI